MSVSGYYGAPTYAAAPPPPPPHAGYYQHPQHFPPPPAHPPPAPVYHSDPASFRREFTGRLAELTINSRPIIQGLSMMAHEYTRYSEIVAHSLEQHIRRIPPWVKLPSFYLLDMISKNIYDPYARHFAAFVVPLFLQTYDQVDNATRSKMEELVMTWRTGSPTGKELFGIPAQAAIERGIWGDGSSSSTAQPSGHITKAQVLSELEFTLGQKERAVQANPYDTLSASHIAVLHQLRKLVEAGVSQEELKQILGQLHSLGRSTAPPAPPPPQPVAPAWQAPVPVPAPISFPPGPPPPANFLPPGTSAPIAPPANLSDILSSLLKAGVVTGVPKQEEKPQVVGRDLEASRSYRHAILAQNMQLSTAAITRKASRLPDFLYRSLPSQCKQCGVRFPDTVVGRKDKEDHLDFHFKQNRKAKENVGRGHSRSWFVGLEDWVHDISDVKGKGRADGGRPINAKAAAAAAASQRDADLRAQFVVVPPGDEAMPVSCPICKEVLKSEFLEEDEEWVWKNAVRKEDRIYHATCHAEALTSTTSLAARLRNELGASNTQSRSSTPDRSDRTPPHSGSAENVTGVKRKAESAHDELPGTPPSKKIALTPVGV